MTERYPQLLRWTYLMYGTLVVAMTVFLLYGRPPIMDKHVTSVELVLLLPGLILYFPFLLLSGGVYRSLLPVLMRVPLWGILNIVGYLAIPPAIRGIARWWQTRKASDNRESILLDLLRRPRVLVVLGAIFMLVGINGAILIWQGTEGTTDLANIVLGPVGAIGLWFLAYQRMQGRTINLFGPEAPAWIRWAVPLSAVIGAVIGGRLAYGEVRILRWTKASADVLAIGVTVITLLIVWIVWRVVRKHQSP